MNVYTIFALLLCAVIAMVSGEPVPSEDIAPAAAPIDEVLEGAESRRGGGYGGYGGYGGGGGGRHHDRHHHHHG